MVRGLAAVLLLTLVGCTQGQQDNQLHGADGGSAVGTSVVCVDRAGSGTGASAGNAGFLPRSAFPGADWEVRSPESQGMNSAALDDAMAYLGSLYTHGGTDGVLVIKNGYQVWSGAGTSTRQTLYSAGKCLVTAIVGKMIEENYFALDSVVHGWEPTLDKPAKYQHITLKHLLTMTSGYDAVNTPAHTDKWGKHADDWSTTPADPAPPRFEPGACFLYWDDAVHLTHFALTRKVHQTLDSYFRQKIATPIGAGDWVWRTFADSGLTPTRIDGTVINGILVDMTARDFARFGLLFLNHGYWDGAQIINRSFMVAATTNQVPRSVPLYRDCNSDPAFELSDHGDLAGSGIYGYHLWVNGIQADGRMHLPDAPPKTYYANGGWSVMFVVPEWQMVLVRVGHGQPTGGVPRAWNEILKRVGKAM